MLHKQILQTKSALTDLELWNDRIIHLRLNQLLSADSYFPLRLMEVMVTEEDRGAIIINLCPDDFRRGVQRLQRVWDQLFRTITELEPTRGRENNVQLCKTA